MELLGSVGSRSSLANGKANPSPCLVAEFFASAPGLAGHPTGDEPEIALAGRSNPGKPSVLNRLAARLAALPDYGYARAGQGEQARWQEAVNEYLSFREQLAGVLLVTDIRHPGSPFDEQLIAWATASEMPLHILLNKADKLKYGARRQALARCRSLCGEQMSAQLFSATEGMGVEELAEVVERWLAGHV